MSKLLFIILSIFSASVIFMHGDISNFSNKVYFSSVIIQIFSLYKIFSLSNRSFSLNKIFYLFILFFFGIAPLIQYNLKASFFGAREIKEIEYFTINILIIFIIIIYQIFYSLFSISSVDNKNLRSIKKFEIKNKYIISQNIKLLILSLLSFLIYYWFNNFNIYSMLIRGGEFKESNQDTSSSLMLVITQVVRPISMIVLFYYLMTPKRNKIILSILFLLAVLTCFPLGMPRFFAAALYIPLLLITIPYMRKGNNFSLIFVLSLLVIFPFLNSFRDFDRDTKIDLAPDFDMFTTGHFDSYQNFALIILEDIVTWGNQLLGVLLFWLPRTVWPDKPIGSGAYLAHQMNFSFDNVSANYFAEGYINFGFFGVFLFIIILAYFTARMDKLYWQNVTKLDNNLFKVIYYIMLGMLFFVMRGDLLSSFAFTIGYLLAFYLVLKIVNSSSYR